MDTGNNTTYVYPLKIVGFKFFCIQGCVFGVASLLILVINIGAVYTIATNSILHRAPTNIFIASSCIADILYGLTVFVYETAILLGLSDVYNGSVVRATRFSYAFAALSIMGTLLTILYIAIERGIATFKPLKYKQWVTSKRAIIITTATWLYLFIVVPSLTVGQYLRSPDSEKMMYVYTLQACFPFLVFETFISLHLYIPIAMSIPIYCSISRAVHKQSKQASLMTTNGDIRTQRHSLKVTKMSMLLLGLQLVSWSPYAVTNIFIPMPDPDTEPEKFRVLMMVSSSAVIPVSTYCFANIIIYAYNHKDFRAVVRAKWATKSTKVSVLNSATTTSTQ